MRKSGVWWCGKRVKVFWDETNSWQHGTVVDFDSRLQHYKVQYDDEDYRWEKEADLFLESKEENHKVDASSPSQDEAEAQPVQVKKRKQNNSNSNHGSEEEQENTDLVPLALPQAKTYRRKFKLALANKDDNNNLAEDQNPSSNGLPGSQVHSAEEGSESSGGESPLRSDDMTSDDNKKAVAEMPFSETGDILAQFPEFDPPEPVVLCTSCGKEKKIDHRDFDIVPASADRSYVFRCSSCVGGKGKLNHLPKTWTEIALTAIYNLELIHRRQYFHSKAEICNFVDKHWASVCMGKTRTTTWWATLHAQITQNRHLFRTVSYGSGYWGILHENDQPNEPVSGNKPAHRPKTERFMQKLKMEKETSADADEQARQRSFSAFLFSRGGKGSPHLKGVTCHQCRNRKSTLVSCTEPTCTKRFCEGCLDKHYGLDIHEVMSRESWKCMNCLGVCSCISCKRSRGEATPFQGTFRGSRGKQAGRPSKRGGRNASWSEEELEEEVPASPRKKRRSETNRKNSESLEQSPAPSPKMKRATRERNITTPSWRMMDDEEENIPEVDASSESGEDTSDEKFASHHKQLLMSYELGAPKHQSFENNLIKMEITQPIINDVLIPDLNDIRLELLVDNVETVDFSVAAQ